MPRRPKTSATLKQKTNHFSSILEPSRTGLEAILGLSEPHENPHFRENKTVLKTHGF